jgi:hypothetical protein
VVRSAGHDDTAFFVKPMEVDESFTRFIDYVRDQELGDGTSGGDVKYSQARERNR